MELEFINMNRTENYKSASERLKDAQQLLLMAIEKGALSLIDRDLLLEKLRKAYDSILFEGEIENPSIAVPAVNEPIKVKADKVHEPSIPIEPEVKPQIVQEPKTALPKSKTVDNSKVTEKVSIFDPSVKGLSKIDEKVEEPMKEKPKAESILNVKQPESLAEKLQGKRKFMTDSLSNQIKEKPVASQLQEKPIADLTKEIGVHDRFLFTKELFDGDSKSFEETLNRVNQFNEISEALIYIQENFSWNENNKAANKFIELIRRKLLND